MFDTFNADKYTRLRYDNSTGQRNRQWIRYADGMFEPVRKEGDLMKKSRTNDPAEDWWVTDRPRDWDPRDHGFEATLNHGTSLMGKNPNQRTMPEGAMTTVPVQDGNAASGIGPTGEPEARPTPAASPPRRTPSAPCLPRAPRASRLSRPRPPLQPPPRAIRPKTPRP
jgi:hypothetical protein